MPTRSASRSLPPTTAGANAANAPPRARFPATVLVVDDDEAVRITTAMILEDLGYRVLESGTGEGALELLRGHSDIALLLTDVVMPGMNGVELARRVRAMSAVLPILFFSGYADPGSVAGDVILQPIIRKPFRAGELAAQIDAALTRARDAQSTERTPEAR
jgi:CheY-like chemotaxis protein